MNNLSLKIVFKPAAFILGCLFFYACENDQATIDMWTKPKALIEEAKDIESFLSQAGKVRAKLWAPYMLRYSGDTMYVEFTKSLRVNFFDSVGQVESHLKALYGKYYENLNKVYLRDSVLVYNIEGDTLRCPDLWWDQNTQQFYTDKNVWVKKGNTTLTGTGMTAKQDLTDILIKQPAGLVDVPDSLRAQ